MHFYDQNEWNSDTIEIEPWRARGVKSLAYCTSRALAPCRRNGNKAIASFRFFLHRPCLYHPSTGATNTVNSFRRNAAAVYVSRWTLTPVLVLRNCIENATSDDINPVERNKMKQKKQPKSKGMAFYVFSFSNYLLLSFSPSPHSSAPLAVHSAGLASNTIVIRVVETISFILYIPQAQTPKEARLNGIVV